MLAHTFDLTPAQPRWFRLILLLMLWISMAQADDPQSDPQPGPPGQAAPSTLKNMTLEQLSQIEVTSPSKEPRPAFRSPVAIYVITGDDIRRSGVTTIPDALRLAPGVEVARIDGSKWSIGIRGFGTRLTRDVLVLIDGRTVYTPLFAGTYWEVQDTLLEDIDRIEVIRGPGGTVWGPNAVNGVINIITKSSKDTHGAFVSAGGGNEEQGFSNARYGGEANGINYRVYEKDFTRGPEHHFDHDNFDDWRGIQGGFRMDWSAGTRDDFTVQGDTYRQEDGERVSLTTYTPPFTGNVDGNAQLSGGNVMFHWTRTLDNGDNFQLQAYYDRTNRYEPNLGENRDTFDVDFQARTKIGSRQELLYGAGARSSQGHFIEVASGLVFSPFNRNDYLVSGFLEDDITLTDKLMLTAGSKILNTNYTGVVFEPSARLLFTPTDRQTYWAAYTHAVRTPSDAEEDFYLSSLIGMAPNGLPYFARFNANPNFAPEKLNGYEAGYRQLIGKNLYIDLSTFYNHYHDLFSEDIIGAPFVESTLPFPAPVPPPLHVLLPAQFRNDILGYTKGFEIAPEWRPTDFWRLRGSYSYLHMNLEQVPAPGAIGLGTASIVGSSPQHEVTVDSSFDITKKLDLDLVYRFVSGLPAQKAPAYSTGDARIAWRFTEHFEFSLTGQNLFQPYHVEYAADPGLPVAIIRNVFASLAWHSK
jgi:iron complex outermembrane receptor protein